MRTRIQLLLAILFLFVFAISTAQPPERKNAAEILKGIHKLKVLGNLLYVAAHPDDENTQLISYFAQHDLVNTAYFSCTRGDGGQNLIGPEISEKLGIIRTQELLAARRLDGGQQFFSRAIDFGYSKHPDETFKVWEKEKVLSDLVWVIRTFKPEVIITRFNDEPGRTHGHHTASAMLAREAFYLAGNPESFPDQLQYVDVWQPERLFWNTSWWFYGSRDFDDEGMIKINAGEYDPLLGLSYTELSARSRSMHKSQGFGATGSRGENLEYLVQWEGKPVKESLFEGLDLSWKRIVGGSEIEFQIEKIIDRYDPAKPGEIVDALVDLRKSVLKLEEGIWKNRKLSEIDDLIYHAAGLFLEVRAHDFSIVPGAEIDLEVEAINRSGNEIYLEGLILEDKDTSFQHHLANNQKLIFNTRHRIREDRDISQPYWLQDVPGKGMFVVNDQTLIGKAENDAALSCRIKLSVNGETITFRKPVVYKTNDPVNGEVYRPFILIDPVHIILENDVYIFPDDSSRNISVIVKAGRDQVRGTLRLAVDDGWQIKPVSAPVDLKNKNEEQVFSFQVIPPEGQSVNTLQASVTLSNGRNYRRGYQIIDYDHIPVQTIFPPAETKMVKLDISKKGNLIGYIQGAGDDIPKSLEQIGYKVQYLTDDDFTNNRLQQFDAIIAGIRAYNTVDELSYHQSKLMDYVRQGGTMIVQYNTSHRLVIEDLAPYPLQLSRDRVTVEESPVTVLAGDHPVMTEPNQITQADFSGWVQERGLYFPDQWDDRFVPVLSCHDPGETPKRGGLLVAEYGEGHYIYTGYSWFRELPAGVPGAFRIFANLISLGN